ncbi:MAG: macro domain-containing protein [Acholeplasmataceae bacterium]|nr:macro domain-containing protein [Acholeplasmataceae bacterium]
MPFKIMRQDITKMKVDAIVNSTSSYPGIGGGVDLQIHDAAGPLLLVERKSFGFLDTTKVIITKGYDLDVKYVFHTVGPVYLDGKHNERELLHKTYENVLNKAHEKHLESIAFPLIAAGLFGFPRGQALEIALNAIKEFLLKSDMMIYLVVYDEQSYLVSLERFETVKSYIEQEQVVEEFHNFIMHSNGLNLECSIKRSKKSRKLEDIMDHVDDSFVTSLFQHIDDRKLGDIDVYKKANIDRKLFSKIKCNIDYQPSKITVIAFSIALGLNLDETKDLLAKAGFALSKSSKFDLIIRYYIENEIYDMYEINQMLISWKQKTIGLLD